MPEIRMWEVVSTQPLITGIVTVTAGLILIFAFRIMTKQRKKNQQRKQWDSAGEDVVVLHQFIRGKYCINLSPYAVKVETFLRLANIKYIVDSESPFGPKRKCPWITLNGQDLGDSQMIVQKLMKVFNVDLDSHLDARSKALMETVRLTADEYVFWVVITWRYYLDGCVTFLKSQSFPPFLRHSFPLLMKKSIKTKAIAHGIGVHTEDEIYGIAKKTCQTLATVLGDDPFYGGERPCTTDCAVFGQLSQLMWNAPDSHYEELVRELYPTLAEYCNRMKDTVFPDWNKMLNPPQK